MSNIARNPSPDDQERVLAAASHFAILGGFWLIVPVLVYLWKRESSKFVAFHALQAALLAVAAIPFWIGSFLLSVLFGLAASILFGTQLGLFALEPLLWFGTVGLSGGVIVLSATWGGVKALQGERWSLPLLGSLAENVLASGVARSGSGPETETKR